MLKRSISAFIMLAVAIPIIILGDIYFKIACVILSLMSYIEILKLTESHSKIPLEIVICSMTSLCLMTLQSFSFQNVIILFFILFIPTLFYKGKKYQTKDAMYLGASIILFSSSFNSLIILRMQNIHFVLYLLCTTIATDTFAYLVGSAIGKHKIAPSISPKKSLEGCVGGTILGTILPTIYYMHFIGNQEMWIVLIITFIISIMGQLGDLFFSKIKRENNIKDFSNLIPGHGGVLDRADSTVFAVLTLMLFISIL